VFPLIFKIVEIIKKTQSTTTMPDKKQKEEICKDMNRQIVDCSTPEGRERFRAMLMSKGWKVGKDKKLRPAQEQVE